ncbi:hypothetical protein D3C83_77430 [compost metagenome]
MRPNISWRTTPNGEASYRFLVRRETTTEMSPDEIHALGQSEVARIRALMETTMRVAALSSLRSASAARTLPTAFPHHFCGSRGGPPR